MSDKMQISILPDGTIKTETDPISAANHSSAEGFLALVGNLAGGPVSRKRKQGATQEHQHEHTHEQ